MRPTWSALIDDAGAPRTDLLDVAATSEHVLTRVRHTLDSTPDPLRLLADRDTPPASPETGGEPR